MLVKLLGLAVLVLTPRGFVSAVQPRPNIILLVTDDQRWDTLGSTGNDIIHTPHLDSLAREGVLFTNCFCTTSICCTSRASILSGQYARRHGIWKFETDFTQEAFAKTFPAVIRAAGYRTGFVGKWGVGNAPPKDEYDYWGVQYPGQGRYYDTDDFRKDNPDLGEHLTHQLAQKAVEFLHGCSNEQPFCLQVSFKAPHCQGSQPWQFPFDMRLKELYQDTHISPAKTATDTHFHRLPEFIQTSEARIRWHRRFDGEAMFQESVKDYYRLISGVDVAVGEIVQVLQEKRFAENTIIIFTSDNGFYLGEYGLAGKWFMHEPSIRLPLFVYDPRQPQAHRGKEVDPLVLNIDLAPTILDAAGVKIPDAMQGQSLMPIVLEKDASGWREEFLYEHFFEYSTLPKTEGVRGVRWKYVRYPTMQPVYEELYDLKRDPLEEINLAMAPAHQKTLATMREHWKRLAAAAESKVNP